MKYTEKEGKVLSNLDLATDELREDLDLANFLLVDRYVDEKITYTAYGKNSPVGSTELTLDTALQGLNLKPGEPFWIYVNTITKNSYQSDPFCKGVW